jgi:hypothetical protein
LPFAILSNISLSIHPSAMASEVGVGVHRTCRRAY